MTLSSSRFRIWLRHRLVSGGGHCRRSPAREVVTLLARLIARSVLIDSGSCRRGREVVAMSEATTVLGSAKIGPVHLGRDAYVYVRQSTLTQLREHTESLMRQYELRERAVALGWDPHQVRVIDADLGRSGAEATARQGFKDLVADVGLGRVGIVFGIEVSRLARNNADWYQLLDLCALTDTLIADADGIYHPADFNDRLVLGLKGTMSEAELHLIRSRLTAGLRHKAARGELRQFLPVGFDYDETGAVMITPTRRWWRRSPRCSAASLNWAPADRCCCRCAATGCCCRAGRPAPGGSSGSRRPIRRCTTSSPIRSMPGRSCSAAPAPRNASTRPARWSRTVLCCPGNSGRC